MAAAVPLITTAITAGSAYKAHKQGKKELAQKRATLAEQRREQKARFDDQSKELAEEKRLEGSRRRISSLRRRGPSTLFSQSGFGGTRTTLAG